MKTKPFFDKRNSENSTLFADTVDTTVLTTAKREKLLANEIPALTFAVGHRGVGGFKVGNNINIRAECLPVGKPWPRTPVVNREWRHSDFINVAYPYLFGFYDRFKSISQPVVGVAP